MENVILRMGLAIAKIDILVQVATNYVLMSIVIRFAFVIIQNFALILIKRFALMISLLTLLNY